MLRRLGSTATGTSVPTVASSRVLLGSRRFQHGLPDFTKPRILVTGASGQIGTDLVAAFRRRYGNTNVIATDIRKAPSLSYTSGPYKHLNVLDKHTLEKLVVDNSIEWIVHLSAIMSVLGEANPQKCIDLNVQGTTNVLELSRQCGLRCFVPSTMAVFSEASGKDMTKDDTILNPTTVYGITKVFLEQLGTYYNKKFDVDFRSLRYPGIISADALPGGGTTDYAVWMFYYALEGKKYTCPVCPDEPLPMMYMQDCLKGTIDLIVEDRANLKRCVYNITGLSFTPAQLHATIKKYIPGFEVEYKPDVAQEIASSWPNQMDDTNAKRDFSWVPQWDLDAMVRDMLVRIAKHKGLPPPAGL